MGKPISFRIITLRNIIVGLTATSIIAGCKKYDSDVPPVISATEIVRIPVVVHVLYATDAFNISDEKIRSQIAVLNQDFRKQNADVSKTPQAFSHLVGDAGIEFELAIKDPQGMPTSGITRTYSELDGSEGNDPTGTKPVEELKVFFTAKGGHDAWPTDRYLNIWIVEMSNRFGELVLAGYAKKPGSDPRIDGVVIDPRVFGTIAPLQQEHGLGRTATHEIGHWLNLLHIYGNPVDNCQSTDFVDDTPTASGPHYGNPTYPQLSCGTSSMFMNFMDYVDDEAMYMFTKGQCIRMRAVFAPGEARNSLYKNIAHR